MEFRTHLVGASFRDAEAQATVLSLEPETALVLEREPANPYDPNAIQVIFEGQHLGFVPKDVAVELSPWLDSGAGYECHCTGHMRPLKPFLRIRIFAGDDLEADLTETMEPA